MDNINEKISPWSHCKALHVCLSGTLFVSLITDIFREFTPSA